MEYQSTEKNLFPVALTITVQNLSFSATCVMPFVSFIKRRSGVTSKYTLCGRGYLKFNTLLLKHKKYYITVVKETINEVKNTYIRKNNDMGDEANTQNISNEQIEFTINDQLFLETLLLMIREIFRIIAFSF